MGNLYGTTIDGGSNGEGVLYELMPSGGGWTESPGYSFGSSDSNPYSGLVFDKAGNLYGTTTKGGYGTVYQLARSGSGWVENTLYSFQDGNDGAYPYGGVIFDQLGNLYGTTASSEGNNSGGSAFELILSNGEWTLQVLHDFGGKSLQGPHDSLTMDAVGNLYGTAYGVGANNLDSVFMLSPSGDGGWTYTTLHNFNGSDGAYPIGGVVLDASGNFYGTASEGGTHNVGVVWEITR